jgi:hypothetical protein
LDAQQIDLFSGRTLPLRRDCANRAMSCADHFCVTPGAHYVSLPVDVPPQAIGPERRTLRAAWQFR